jgi:hypothetical protein
MAFIAQQRRQSQDLITVIVSYEEAKPPRSLASFALHTGN